MVPLQNSKSPAGLGEGPAGETERITREWLIF